MTNKDGGVGDVRMKTREVRGDNDAKTEVQ